MTTVKQLVQQLQNPRRPGSPLKPSEEEVEKKFQTLKVCLRKSFKPQWKMSGIPHQREEMKVLKNRQLNNWEISRMPLSKRSYCYPKNYRGIKTSEKSLEFSHCDSKDKEGHLPYLYESEVPKIERIRSLIHQRHFRPVNTAKTSYFGSRKARHDLSHSQSCCSAKSLT